jgi:hypothetical protein
MKLDETVNQFSKFLSEEYGYLLKIKLFLLDVPGMITAGNINELEFQGFLEKYEVETSRFLFEKNRYKEEIAGLLNVPREQVTFKLLVSLGYLEFDNKAHRVLKIANEITMNLLKVSVFIRNFARMNQEMKRLNTFLYQEDYSPTGMETGGSYTYQRGGNFYGEA